MNLLEHEAKRLLSTTGIPVPASKIVNKEDNHNLTFPAVLKSQVPTGGRGKAGGILIVDAQEEAEKAIKKLFTLPIKGHFPTSLLAEEKLNIDKEFYLSLLFDRDTMSLQLLAQKEGGIEVEDQTDFQKWPITGKKDANPLGQALADYFDLPSQTFALQDLIENLYKCFLENDATLIEINPLILTKEGKPIAGDCKMTLDDAAAFRHEWNFEDTPHEANFVTIDEQGNMATIANGAGLAMATVDAAVEAGLKPANFLDIGGGANADTLLAAFRRILDYPNIQAIVINIFAGITRSDEVARAIIAARKQIKDLPPLFIRLAGTNYEAAAEILQKEDIAILPDLSSCLQAAQEVTHE